MFRRRFLFVFALAALLCFSATSSALAAHYADTITGHEYYFTSTDGRFAGTASGALPGAWNADVRHTPLCLSCTPTATITGGSFSLATTYTLVTGRFTGGTVQVINRGVNCTNQTFDVEGILGSVGHWYSGRAPDASRRSSRITGIASSAAASRTPPRSTGRSR